MVDNLLENIRFERLNRYIHCYHVPGLHDYLSQYKDNMLKVFNEKNEQFLEKFGSRNVPISNDSDLGQSRIVLDFIAQQYYYVDKQYRWDEMGVYIQDHTTKVFEYHTHNNDMTVMVGTMYINPPENRDEGGGLQLNFPVDFENLKIGVKKDWIYIFPSYILHRPTAQTTKTPRLCFNWTYQSRKKPIHKLSGDIW